MAESIFDALLHIGLSEKQVLLVVFWFVDSWQWIICGNVIVAGAINRIRLRHGDCVTSWSLLTIMLMSIIAMGLLTFTVNNLGVFLGWLLATSLTLNLALGRKTEISK